MQVKDIMSHPDATVTPTTPLIEVVSLMCLYRHSGLPVVDNGMLVGTITEKDILARLLPDIDIMMDEMAGIDLNYLMHDYTGLVRLMKVSDLMTDSVTSVPPEMHILKAASLMANKRLPRVPVANEDVLVGILSLSEVHKAIFHRSVSSSMTAA